MRGPGPGYAAWEAALERPGAPRRGTLADGRHDRRRRPPVRRAVAGSRLRPARATGQRARDQRPLDRAARRGRRGTRPARPAISRTTSTRSSWARPAADRLPEGRPSRQRDGVERGAARDDPSAPGRDLGRRGQHLRPPGRGHDRSAALGWRGRGTDRPRRGRRSVDRRGLDDGPLRRRRASNIDRRGQTSTRSSSRQPARPSRRGARYHRADDPRPCRRCSRDRAGRLLLGRRRPRDEPRRRPGWRRPSGPSTAASSSAVEVRGDRNQAGIQIGQLQQLVATQSMFGGGSLAVVTNAGALTVRNEDRDGLLAILPLVAPGSGVVFVEASQSGAREPGQKRLVDGDQGGRRRDPRLQGARRPASSPAGSRPRRASAACAWARARRGRSRRGSAAFVTDRTTPTAGTRP